MTPFEILVSTTSHKQEALDTTLEVFARLGMTAIDLNLHHVFTAGEPVSHVLDAVRRNGQHISVVSGGWCDFYDAEPQIEKTFASVERQIGIARALGVHRMRLFFGRLPASQYSSAHLAIVAANIRRLAAANSDVSFAFENHDGASLQPAICREILETVDAPNVRMNFDPINFARAGVDPEAALGELRPLVTHVHLKGCSGGECCEFGSGDVDLIPFLRSLADGGYRGAFTVEYEGPFDRTVRLYEGFRRAEAAVARLVQVYD